MARPIIQQLKTQAETALATAFATTRDPKAPALLAQRRDAAFAAFDVLGLPNKRVEAWHYTDMRALMRDAYPVAKAVGGAVDGLRLSIVDGTPAPGLANHPWPAGLRIRSLKDALRSDDGLIAQAFVKQGGEDAMVSLNAAMASDGVVIEVEAGVRIQAPIELHFASSGTDPRSDFSRSIVIVEDGASVSIIESHASSAKVQRNNALIFHVGEGAGVDHVFVTEGHAAELHVASLIVELAASARFDSFGFIAGGQALRRQCYARCAGENVKIAFRGVSLLSGKQHADNTLVIDHAVPHGQSRELFKHILADEATGVFQGKVVVRPHAQKTDGGMKSQSLLLSDDAAIYNKPELEIFADDVVCGHGATVGQLDKDQVFYLMARGLPRARAEALLLEGFAREAIEFVASEPIRERLNAALAEWLERRS